MSFLPDEIISAEKIVDHIMKLCRGESASVGNIDFGDAAESSGKEFSYEFAIFP